MSTRPLHQRLCPHMPQIEYVMHWPYYSVSQVMPKPDNYSSMVSLKSTLGDDSFAANLFHSPYPTLPLSLSQHNIQNPPVRISPTHLTRSHWRASQTKRKLRCHQFPLVDRNHSPLSTHHGSWVGTLEDGRDLYRPKDFAR